MNLNTHINQDHELLILELEPDELEIAKVCALRVRSHLERLSKANPKYLANLTMVNTIISQYEKALKCGTNTATQ